MNTTEPEKYVPSGHNAEGSIWWLRQDGVKTKVHLHYIDGKGYFYPEWAALASLR